MYRVKQLKSDSIVVSSVS